jgi:hypothetical protein
MATTTQRENHSPSLWAFILIAAGVIWLLFEAHILSGANLAVLLRLWPVLLIALGVELLFGRRSRGISLLIGVVTVLLLLALMVIGPALGLAPNVEVKTAQYSEALDDATAAQINLNLSVGHTTIDAGSDSTLFDAALRYVGEVEYDVSTSGGEKYIVMSTKNDSSNVFDFLGLSLADTLNEEELYWNVNLSPAVLLDLRLSGGVGKSDLDLTSLQMSNLSYDGGVGETTISLPGSGSYDVDLKGGVGSTRITFGDSAGVDATINAGVGEIVLDVPDNGAVRVETEGGLGGIDVAFPRISTGDDDHDGVWESESYASADASQRITIRFKGGVGSLIVR